MTTEEVFTWLDLVKEVGHEFGQTLTDEQADSILWNHTGFPSFWKGGDPIEECRRQLRAALGRTDI